MPRIALTDDLGVAALTTGVPAQERIEDWLFTSSLVRDNAARLQHARMLRREYDVDTLARLGLDAAEWRRMRFWYQATYGWRHARKSETSYVLGRGLDRVVYARKLIKHHYHHAVYRVLVTLHALRNRG